MMQKRFPSERIDFKTLVPNLAMFIRKLPIDRKSIYDRTSELSTLLFGTPDKAEHVWSSIKSYDIVSPQGNLIFETFKYSSLDNPN